jgi:hypothetical protein
VEAVKEDNKNKRFLIEELQNQVELLKTDQKQNFLKFESLDKEMVNKSKCLAVVLQENQNLIEQNKMLQEMATNYKNENLELQNTRQDLNQGLYEKLRKQVED